MATLALPAAALRQAVARNYSILLLLVGWEALCRSGAVPPVLLPSVSAVLARAIVDLQDPDFLFQIGQTLIRLFSGLVIAVVLGISCGILAAQFTLGRRLLEPLVRLFAPIPKIALFPALLLIFGFDHLSRIILVLIDAIFPVLLAAYYGARAIDERLIWSARAAGTNDAAMVWKIVLPAALPAILTGVRIAVVIACVVAFLSEMIQPGDGLGSVMIRAARSFQTVDMFVPILVISLLGFAMDHALAAFRRRVLKWTGEES
jgi:ABC-type nitrate/sulfonate/bicarbonate transport system permease component